MEELNIAVYTTELKDIILEGIDVFKGTVKLTSKYIINVDVFDKREKLLYSMRENNYDIAIIAENGARGFEATLGIRDSKNLIPLIWITSDEVFGVQSYRMKVQDFLVTPVSPQQINNSLARCMEYREGRLYEKWYS